MKNKKHHHRKTVLKLNRKIIEAKWIPLTHVHDHSHSWLGTGTLIKKNDRVKLVLRIKTSPLSEITQVFSTCE